jgi:hypothetical protein
VRATLRNALHLGLTACLAALAAGCGEFIRQDRAPVTLVIDSLVAAPGASQTFGGTLQSDVVTGGGVFNDSGRVTIRIVMKDVTVTPSPINTVTINRYRVTFRRSDGRNTPGVDVPYPFDSALNFSVGPSGSTAGFELVRHIAKNEAPLAALRDTPTLVNWLILSTVADITFYGRDQAGNELSVTGSIGVQFGDFADPS